MIHKIDPMDLSPKNLSPPLKPPKARGADFHSLLEGKIEETVALEKIALEYLKKAIDLALSETQPERNDLFLSPPPFFLRRLPALHTLPSPPQSIESESPPLKGELQPAEVEPELEASNNLPGEQNFELIVREAGLRYGVDPSLIKALIQVESGGNPLAVSKAGARGLMQLMPETAAEMGVSHPFDPVQNIMGGTRYLRKLLDRYRGDVQLALAAYNWGMGNLEKRPEAMPRETKIFISRVENLYRNSTKA